MKKYFFFFSFIIASILLASKSAFAQAVTLPSINLGFKSTDNPGEVVNAIKIVMLLTVLSLAPAILIMMTSFTRIIVVLSFMRQALGTQQMPPNQLLVGLALFLTFFIMAPAFNQINENALKPYLDNKISQEKAADEALAPIRAFMWKQTRAVDVNLFIKLAKIEKPKTRADVPTTVLIPSFIISELKTAFQI